MKVYIQMTNYFYHMTFQCVWTHPPLETLFTDICNGYYIENKVRYVINRDMNFVFYLSK